MQEKFIESDRLYLRKLTIEDVSLLYQLDSNPEVMKYIGPVRSMDTVRKRVQEVLEENKKLGNLGLWIAHQRSDNAFIGWFVLHPLDKTEAIEVGYRLLPSYWGKGYATEMTKILIRYGFEEVGLDKIVGITHPDNIASQKVLLKAGLTYSHDAVYYDTNVKYYIINPNVKNIKQNLSE